MTSPQAPATLAGPGWRPRPGNAQWIGARQEQEDAFGFAGFDARGQAGPDGVLAVVADGMGGLSEGRAASQGAVSGFLAAWAGQPPDLAVTERLLGAITAANQVVHNLARATAGEGEVGTTLVAAAIHQGHLFWISAGDSRLYLYRAADASLSPCNEEHNLALQLWREAPADGPTPDWIEGHPQRDALISFLGLAEIPEIDRNLRPLALEAGDRLLLCSDGVDGVLSPDELKEGLNADPQTAAEGLVARLQGLQRLYQDNATVAILACEGWDAPTRVSPMPAVGDGVRPRRRLWPGRWALALVVLMLVVGLGVGVGVGWWQGGAQAPPAHEAGPPAASDQPKPAMVVPTLDPAPAAAPAPASAPAPAHTPAPDSAPDPELVSVPLSVSPGAEVPPVKADTSDETTETSKGLETSR